MRRFAIEHFAPVFFPLNEVLGATGGASAKALEEFVSQRVPAEGPQVYSLYNVTKSLQEKLFCKGECRILTALVFDKQSLRCR